METRFIKTKKTDLSFVSECDGKRTQRVYPEGAIVETSASFAKELVEDGHADYHDGPAFDPSAVRAKAGKVERA